MISPAKLDKLPSEVVNLVQELQEEIIRDVCRRVTKANYLTPTAEWELYKANQLRLSYNEVNRRIARQLNVRERTVRELYTDTVKQALKEDADIYRTAAAMGRLPDSTGSKIDSYFRSAAFSMLLSKGLKKSRGQLRNLCDSMAAEANRELSDAMDLAHLKVISGAFSYDEAIYTAVKDLSEKGITRVEYPSGRRDFTDVCVRRAVLSSVNKSCCDIQLDLAREVGSRYVEVSAHFGARPSHAEWQGRIYSLVKGDRKYPYFYEATGYGTGEGLGGWNCRHNFFPYFEGIDTPYHTPEFTQTENNEYYALTQTQRRYERAVRDSKRKLAALDGARQSIESPELRLKLDSDFARGSVTLKNREERLNSFIRENGLQRDNARVRVAGFGRSVSRKAGYAARNGVLPPTILNSYKEVTPLTETERKSFVHNFMSGFKRMPEHHRAIVLQTINDIEVRHDGASSGFYYTSKNLRFNFDAPESDVVHECGHILYDRLKLYENPEFNRILKSGLNLDNGFDVEFKTIIDVHNNSYTLPFLKSSKFVKSYQGRLYFDTELYNGVFYDSKKYFIMDKLDPILLQEYFSVGYEYYFYNPKLLKKKDSLLYDYIERLVKNGS